MKPDADYILARNSLINEAVMYTNKLCGRTCGSRNKKVKEEWDSRWSREFLKKMDRLYELTTWEIENGNDMQSYPR
jgi:hypothetical protein